MLHSKQDICVRSKQDKSNESGAEQDLRELAFNGRVFQDGEIAVGMKAAQHSGSRGAFDAESLGTDGDFAVGRDFDESALTEEVRPPRTFGRWAQNPAVLLFGEVLRGLRGHADFTMLFHRVMVFAQRVQEGIGGRQIGDVFGAQQRWEAVLPELMVAFHFAFGLGCGLHPMRTNQNGFLPSPTHFTRGEDDALS